MDPSPGNNRQNHQPPLLNPNTTTESENNTSTSTTKHNNGQRPRGLQKFRDILLMKIADKATPSEKSLIAKGFDDFFSDPHIPDHPPYAEMIQRAIRELNEAGGSDEEAISKFIREKYNDLPLAHVSMLKHHLKKLCQAGEIVVTGNQTYLLYHGNLIHIPRPHPSRGPSPSSSFSLSHSSSSSPSPKRKQTKRKTRRKRSRRRGRSLKKSEVDYGVGEECNEQQKQGKEVNKKQNEPEEQQVENQPEKKQQIKVPTQPFKRQNDERITSEGEEQDDIDPEKPPGFEHVTITEALDNQYHGGPQLPAGRGRGHGRGRGRPPQLTPEDGVATERQGRGRLPMKQQSRYRVRGRQRKLDFGV